MWNFVDAGMIHRIDPNRAAKSKRSRFGTTVAASPLTPEQQEDLCHDRNLCGLF